MSATVRHRFDEAPLVRFETFVFSAAATVLITRITLAATGYPRVGGGSLHIAHVLWGGLLLGVAMTMMMVSLAAPARFWASVIGGVGFGLFIDEVGKFLTKDVNYFYRPAVAIIYAVLLFAYLAGREALTRMHVHDARARAIAAQAVADDQLGSLTRRRRDRVLRLLQDAPDIPDDHESRALIELLERADIGRRRTTEETVAGIANRLFRMVRAAIAKRWVRVVVFTAMTVQAVISLAALISVWIVVGRGEESPAELDIGLLIGTATQTVLILSGLVLLAMRRYYMGLHILRTGLFVALVYTTMMELHAYPLSALRDFIAVSVLLFVVSAMIGIESSERERLRIERAAQRPARGH